MVSGLLCAHFESGRRSRPNMKKFIVFMAMVLLFPNHSFALTDKGFAELKVFSDILSYVEGNYVKVPNDEKMIEGAINGMLRTLDPHTVYLTKDAYKELRADTSGRFGGIGIEVGIKQGTLTIVAPLEGSPAARAGIKAGDKIVRIDGKLTQNMTFSDAVVKMRGKNGSNVKLTVRRDGVKDPIDFVVQRQVIKTPSVTYDMIDGHYAYIKIRSFQERTFKDLSRSLESLHKKGDIWGLILDLRNDPGGLLDQCVKVADLFLDSGTIVTTKRRGEVIDTQSAVKEGTEPNYPIVVLINGGTASASEIVSGALQDQKRAVIMGTKSFGKGSVQNIIELENGAALKMTIALYYTPLGYSIQARGITPDVVVKEAPDKKERISFREADLPHHLEAVGRKKADTKVKMDKIELEDGVDDQKEAALQYLKQQVLKKGEKH